MIKTSKQSIAAKFGEGGDPPALVVSGVSGVQDCVIFFTKAGGLHFQGA